MGTPYRLEAIAKARGVTVRELIADALRRNRTKAGAARDLRIGRDTLHRRMEQLGLDVVVSVGGKRGSN
jgi:DNA-binding NtrC family response regulator